MYDTDDRRDFAAYLTAAPGYTRAARGVVSKALRLVLGSGYTKGPWDVRYYSRGYLRGEGVEDPLPFYAGSMTDDEAVRFLEALQLISEEAGWDGAPIDFYHD